MPDPSPSSSPATRWSLPARYLVAVLLLLLAAMTVLLLLPLLQVLLLAFLISFLIFIPARALKRRARLPYSLIIAVFFLVMFGLLACALLTLIPGLIIAFNSMWTSV
jgi:predicted PurR-regulated permease PerM